MRTLPLSCLISSVLLLPAPARGERRAPVKDSRAEKAAPAAKEPPPPAPQKEPEERGSEPNDERDPSRRQRFETRRAEAVERRHLGRALAQHARATRDPLSLLAAARLLQQTPSRPLATAPGGAAPIPPRSAAPRAADPAQPEALLAEARALAAGHPLQREALAMLDRLAATEVVARGAALGPQSACDSLAAGMKVSYHVAYDGNARAALAVSGAGVNDLEVRIHDEQGNLISRSRDRSLLTWFPRWRGVFRIEVENASTHSAEFCLETN